MAPEVAAAWIAGGFATVGAIITALLKKDVIIVPGHIRWKRRVPKGFVLLINGGSGVGKTTLAWALARKFNIASVFGTDLAREVLRHGVLLGQPAEKRTLLRSSFEAYQEMGVLARTTEATIDGFLHQSGEMLRPLIRVINRIRGKRDPVILEGVDIVASQLFAEIPNDSLSKVFLINLFLNSKDAHLRRLRERGVQSEESDPETERYIRNIDPIRDIDNYLRADSTRFVQEPLGVPTNVISFENSGSLHDAVDKTGSALAKRIKWLKDRGMG